MISAESYQEMLAGVEARRQMKEQASILLPRVFNALRRLVAILDRPNWAASGLDHHAKDIADAKAVLADAVLSKAVPHG